MLVFPIARSFRREPTDAQVGVAALVPPTDIHWLSATIKKALPIADTSGRALPPAGNYVDGGSATPDFS